MVGRRPALSRGSVIRRLLPGRPPKKRVWGGVFVCYCVPSPLGGKPAPIVQWPRTPPFQGGDTGSNPVGGAKQAQYEVSAVARSRGAVWSARRPVKPEVAGSNPVGTATTSLVE